MATIALHYGTDLGAGEIAGRYSSMDQTEPNMTQQIQHDEEQPERAHKSLEAKRRQT